MTSSPQRLGWRLLLPVLPVLGLLSGPAWAQAQAAPLANAQADPLDPQARVLRATYRSPLADDRRLGDDAPLSWQEANETVKRIGGWRAYAREAQAAQPTQPGLLSPSKPAIPSTPEAAPATGAPHRH